MICSVCKGTQKIQLFTSTVDCECVNQSVNIQYDKGSGVSNIYGDKYWYLNGLLHRIEGPAVEWPSGTKQWYLNGKLHREDGPAIEWACGIKAWYINGKELTEEEFQNRT